MAQQLALEGSAQVLKNISKNMTDEMLVCVQNCTLCNQICLLTKNYCLTKGGRHLDVQHLRALMDCEQLCRVSADFMLRESKLHSQICNACAEACLVCAQSCESLGAEDDLMTTCASICRQCAESCQEMSLRH